jgi:putative membrane protein
MADINLDVVNIAVGRPMTDLLLAIIHHLLVFSLFAIFAVQMTLIRPGLDAATVRRLARLDGAYGGIALAVLVVGFARAWLGLKGWDYYSTYWVFWAKVGAFIAVGLLSIQPTIHIQRWLRAARADAVYAVPAGEIAAVRVWLMREGAVLLLIPILAAMLARGVGY